MWYLLYFNTNKTQIILNIGKKKKKKQKETKKKETKQSPSKINK
jgi:hypothetical protein